MYYFYFLKYDLPLYKKLRNILKILLKYYKNISDYLYTLSNKKLKMQNNLFSKG